MQNEAKNFSRILCGYSLCAVQYATINPCFIFLILLIWVLGNQQSTGISRYNIVHTTCSKQKVQNTIKKLKVQDFFTQINDILRSKERLVTQLNFFVPVNFSIYKPLKKRKNSIDCRQLNYKLDQFVTRCILIHLGRCYESFVSVIQQVRESTRDGSTLACQLRKAGGKDL